MLTGRRHVIAETLQELAVQLHEKRIPPPHEIVPSIPTSVSRAVMGLLEHDPARRETLAAFAQECRLHLSSPDASVTFITSSVFHDTMGSSVARGKAEALAEPPGDPGPGSSTADPGRRLPHLALASIASLPLLVACVFLARRSGPLAAPGGRSVAPVVSRIRGRLPRGDHDACPADQRMPAPRFRDPEHIHRSRQRVEDPA